MRQVTRPVTVKILTPLPTPAEGLTALQELAERLAKSAGLPGTAFIGMTQENTDLVIYFETELP